MMYAVYLFALVLAGLVGYLWGFLSGVFHSSAFHHPAKPPVHNQICKGPLTNGNINTAEPIDGSKIPELRTVGLTSTNNPGINSKPDKP